MTRRSILNAMRRWKWFSDRCALLEPDAVEVKQSGTFTYTIGAGVTKYMIGSWATRISGTGRMELRDTREPLPLTNCEIQGIGANSFAYFVDPAIPVYSDPEGTYYLRMQYLANADTRRQNGDASIANRPLGMGAYGGIMMSMTYFDIAWAGYAVSMWNEIDDTAPMRVSARANVPWSKRMAAVYSTSSSNTNNTGTYVVLPRWWSVVPDTISASYDFRDDFMAATLDTTTNWNTQVQSTAGNVIIDTQMQWLTLVGNGSWTTNGVISKYSCARSAEKTLVVDLIFATTTGATAPVVMVGWNNNTSIDYVNFAHSIAVLTPTSTLEFKVYENGTDRGVVGSGVALNTVYRLKIKALSGGGATYSVQGGAYATLGSGSWTDITPGTTTSATATLYPAVSVNNGVNRMSDVRVF
jgi:hypothetical protein